MGARIGVIFHKDWVEFSPLMYHHFGEDTIPFQIQKFIKDYYENNSIENYDGHKYDPCHMMVEFLQSIDKDYHIRVQNLAVEHIYHIQYHHVYPNCFDGGCWLINVSTNNYGIVDGDGHYYLENDDLVNSKLENVY